MLETMDEDVTEIQYNVVLVRGFMSNRHCFG